MFKSNIQLQGDPLFYAFPNTFVLKNVCKADISVYLGQKVFLTIDNFESSLLPLTVPKSLAVYQNLSLTLVVTFVVSKAPFAWSYQITCLHISVVARSLGPTYISLTMEDFHSSS